MYQKALTTNQLSILSKIKEGAELISFKSGNDTSYVIKHRGKREAVMSHTVRSLQDRGYIPTDK